MRTNSATAFWKHVEVRSLDDCWEWQGCRGSRGHGHVKVAGKLKYVHRLAYEQLRDEALPTWNPQQELMHSCSNAGCCNPLHLDVGTRRENLLTAGALGVLGRKGEHNGNSKLQKKQVEAIRQDTRSGSVIAQEYGLNRSQVNRIRRGEHWCEK